MLLHDRPFMIGERLEARQHDRPFGRSSALALLGICLGLSACRQKESSGGPDAPAVSTPPVPPGHPAPPVPRGQPAPPVTTRSIAREDCALWADHGVEVVLRDWKDAASGCELAVRDQLNNKLDVSRAEVLEGARSVCMRHIGEPVAAAESACYMAARSARELTRCRFAPLTNPGDSDIVAEIANLRASCQKPPSTAPSKGAPPRDSIPL